MALWTKYYLAILRPFPFNNFFFSVSLEHNSHYFTKYTDDTAPWVISDNTLEVLTALTDVTQKVFAWFANNERKANHDKCHLLLSTQDKADTNKNCNN